MALKGRFKNFRRKHGECSSGTWFNMGIHHARRFWAYQVVRDRIFDLLVKGGRRWEECYSTFANGQNQNCPTLYATENWAEGRNSGVVRRGGGFRKDRLTGEGKSLCLQMKELLAAMEKSGKRLLIKRCCRTVEESGAPTRGEIMCYRPFGFGRTNVRGGSAPQLDCSRGWEESMRSCVVWAVGGD